MRFTTATLRIFKIHIFDYFSTDYVFLGSILLSNLIQNFDFTSGTPFFEKSHKKSHEKSKKKKKYFSIVKKIVDLTDDFNLTPGTLFPTTFSICGLKAAVDFQFSNIPINLTFYIKSLTEKCMGDHCTLD